MATTVEEAADRLEQLARLSRETGTIITSESQIAKAFYDEQERAKEQAQQADPNGIIIDPSNVLNYLGTRVKPSAIGFAILRHMALRCEPVAIIIQTRMNEVARFTRRPRHDRDTGFKIVLKDRKRKPTIEEEKRSFALEDAFLRTGFGKNRMRKDNLNMFVRKIIRDSLTLDAMVWENVPTMDGKGIAEWWALDAETIEPVVDASWATAETAGEYPVYVPQTRHGRKHARHVAYVQRVQGQVRAEFTEEELAYGIRNPRTDLDFALYGLSELELLVETVTNILNAKRYNGSYFTASNLPQGILSIVGGYSEEQLAVFRREWQSMVSGVVGKHKIPLMAAKDGNGVIFTPFKQNNKDMEFGNWMQFLTTIACAMYGSDPSEFGQKGWDGGSGGGGGGGGTDSDAQATKIAHAKDKGFVPLMTFVSDQFNQEILDFVAPEYEFQWVGLDPDDEDRKINSAKTRLEAGITVPIEERATLDIDNTVLTTAGADTSWMMKPVNTVAAGYVTAAQQGEMQADQANQQHQQALEQAAQQHGHATAQADQKFEHAKGLAQSQHGQKLEQTVVGGAVAGQNAEQADARKGGLQQEAHGQKLEQTVVGGAVAGQNAEAQDGRKGDLQQQAHGQAIEQQAMTHEQALAQNEQQGQIADSNAQNEHGRGLEASEAQHQQTLEQGDVQREHESVEKGKDRAAKAPEKPKGSKRKLSKSITIEIMPD